MRTYLNPYRLAPLAIALAAAGAAQADDNANDSLLLSPTVITAVQQQSPLTIVTNPKDARQPVPASDGTDYLKTIPGFAAIRNGGTNGDAVLRGMFGSRLNLRTNGGLMLGACPYRMDNPGSYIAPETFDKLTVIKGPQTVQWGPGASAGTVLFEREPEHFEQLGGRLDASALAGSNGRFDRVLDAALGGPQGYLRLVGNSSQADDYQDGGGHTVPSRWNKWNGDLAMGWTPDADTLLELSAGTGDGEARYGGRSMDGSQFARQSLGLRFEKRNVGGALEKLEANFYYSYADHIMDNFRLRTPDAGSMMPMPMASQVDRRTTGGRLAATWRLGAWEVVAGVDALRSEHRARNSRYDMMSQAYTDTNAFPWQKDAVMHSYGAFGEFTWHASDQSRVVTGARLDRSDAVDSRATLGSMGMARPNPSAGERRAETLPSGFARYEYDLAHSPTTLYAGVGHVQRIPDYWELFSAGNGPAGSANAFEGIKPEKTTQLDIGAQYNGERLQAWASGYAGVVRDFILFDYRSTMGMGSSQARNVDARIAGGELGASYHLTDRWKTDATLAYAWGENRSDHRALAQMPPLEARLGLTWAHQRYSAGMLWRLVAAQNRVAVGNGNVVGQDFASTPGFGVFSLNGAYRLNRHFKLSAGVDNLFGKTYTEHLNLAGDAGFGFPGDRALPEPGRTLWTKVEVSY
ncbi:MULTISPECIES: TonB-dependent copper receptor [unclassified Pseudomonas]|uniref:TonB-dependent copper receptor n=1 Tax=unclassified Pseudomonas TaxID=196821 RepID=UPI000BD538D0|nr:MULTISPECIES: TonB-dependent copper receptor [unclassified Pseudomonas]PVZ13588.1 iron complex outermembrane receptor protein [Pseudomonas sp. URIL14HWK12:I12]PVZ23894.1 iron complex outermembrane receptor protein [Pseudomonas sp. URIL14HWK12:I10]PVZ33467.1 iron complex outermembrane receptor protein [Pseudomonas sp. URIL14HWK12:I11]SNZ11668.1 iron complex outermembrane recepter protein [Pseudomonas sp. URIL14HWK12:I9]